MSLTIETSTHEAEGVRQRLRAYARLTFTERKSWWSGTVSFTVSGDETALARAEVEISDWMEEEMLRRAW